MVAGSDFVKKLGQCPKHCGRERDLLYFGISYISAIACFKLEVLSGTLSFIPYKFLNHDSSK